MTTQVLPLSPFHGMRELVWCVWLEGLRRKEFYAFFIVAFFFLLVALAIRLVGIENPSTATFVLNLGLTYCGYAAHFMVIILAARGIPADIENRTIYPILAKPVQRSTYILGKWFASGLFGSVAMLGLFLLVWIPTPKLEEMSSLLLLQTLLLQSLSLFALSALSLLGSLVLPQAVGFILVTIITFFGGKISGLLNAQFPIGFLRPVYHLIPDFTVLNLWTRYTDGIDPVSPAVFLACLVYALLLIGGCLGFSIALFDRRPL